MRVTELLQTTPDPAAETALTLPDYDPETQEALFRYLLRLGDSVLILGQRTSEWCGHAPVLEEEMALANLGLDLIGQARMLLTYAGVLEGQGRDEDALAFLRYEHEYRNVTMTELPNGDFARTMVRHFLFASWMALLWARLQSSADPHLAAIAGKAVKEARYHQRHAGGWVVRLGDGTALSHDKTQAALDDLWPYTAEWFEGDEDDARLAQAGIAPHPGELAAPWHETVTPTLAEAQLRIPPNSPFRSHGRWGRHSEHMGHLLSEMQYLQRAYPGGKW